MGKVGGKVIRKLIAFVGKGNYDEVKYKLDDYEERSKFPFYLIYKYYNPDEVYIISTKDGLSMWFGEVQKLIPNSKSIEISLPSKNEDIWDLHKEMDRIVGKGDEIVIDITYSFRHIPFMIFSSALYEFRIKDVSLLGIFYGARDANNKDIVPIFDLSGAVELIEWHYALSSFIRHGRSKEFTDIAEKLQKKHDEITWKKEYGILLKITRTIESISNAIYLNQNLKALNACYSLGENLEKHGDTFRKFEVIYPPLHDVMNELKIFTDIGYKEPEKSNINEEILEKLIMLAKHQINIGLIGESIETVREWLVSFVIYMCGENLESWVDRKTRVSAEKALGVLEKEVRGESIINYELTWHYCCMKTKNISKKIIELWSKTIAIRNKVAHSGMTKEAGLSYNDTVCDIEYIVKTINKFFGGEKDEKKSIINTNRQVPCNSDGDDQIFGT